MTESTPPHTPLRTTQNAHSGEKSTATNGVERSPADLQRQDSSGYESATPRRPLLNNKDSQSRTFSSHRCSRGRTATRRPAKTAPVARLPARGYLNQPLLLPQAKPVSMNAFPYYGTNGGSTSVSGIDDNKNKLRVVDSLVSHTTTNTTVNATANSTAHTTASYFPFPSPPVADTEHAASLGYFGQETLPSSPTPPPPQTTHYWTSDRTRRMEYAAIDAASSGFKGWCIRHLVPDCFVPKDLQRVCFDDDTGSVRRYRIALESDGSEKESRIGRR